MPFPARRLFFLGCLFAASLTQAAAPDSWKFDFAPGAAGGGAIAVAPDTLYNHDRGFGFEPDASLRAVGNAKAGAIVSDKPFFFTVRVPVEGNYRVRVKLGDPLAASTTTIKAELRRLMVEKVTEPAGKFSTVTFIVNTRTPHITAIDGIAAGEVKLKAPRETTKEAWGWDDAITLEFNNAHPAVSAIEIERVQVPTIFLIGDSTVCDQSSEPFNSWGQMLTRFFQPDIAIANHGESGETYRDSIGRRRLDKILSVMKPGDYLLMQFGHNDQKQISAGTGGPFTTYKAEIKKHVDGVRARGGIPVIISPMERRNFDDAGKLVPSLSEYAEASRQAAAELKVAFIDLNAMSQPFYIALEAKGHDYSRKAFAGQDNTHHDNYGSYELAKCIVTGIQQDKLGIASHIVKDFHAFDPAHPDPVETFDVPPSPQFSNQRPLGDEGRP